MSRSAARLALALVVSLLATSCLFRRVFVSDGGSCTCAPGQKCDPETQTCVDDRADLSGRDFTSLIDLAMADLTPQPCSGSAECLDPVKPICEAVCRACATNPECTARAASSPYCQTGSGRCVACLQSAHCPTVAAPVCDDGTCRTCRTHPECASGACDRATGQCVSPLDVAYVDNRGQTIASCKNNFALRDGSAQNPFCDINEALVANTEQIVVVTGRGEAYPYDPVVLIDGDQFRIVGPGKRAAVPAVIAGGVAVPAVSASGGTVTLDGFLIGGANQMILEHVVRCVGGMVTPALTIVDSLVRSGAGTVYAGVQAQSCAIALDGVRVTGVVGYGINVAGGTYVIRNSVVHNVSRVGVRFTGGATGTFEFNTVVDNGAADNDEGAVRCDGAQTLAASILVSNKKKSGDQIENCSFSNLVTSGNVTGNLPAIDVAFADGEFHLAPNSALNIACCVDKIGSGPAFDVDVDPRPRGVQWDIGADEVQ